jgi:transposase
MTYQNVYRKKTHLDIRKSRQIIRYFSEDLTASTSSKLLWIERKTINGWYNYIREVISYYALQEDKVVWNWIIEIDESYFWPKRIRWKRWRWAGNKVKVLWLLKREWRIYVQIVPDVSAKSLIPIIRKKIGDESIINTDGWKAYDGLVDIWYEKHYRVIHSQDEFARWNKHINWIESFRSYTKRRLAKFNGIKQDKYLLNLKECEFRFNCWLQKKNIYKELLKLLRNYTSNS